MKPAMMDARKDLDLQSIRRRLEEERDSLKAESAATADDRRPVMLDQQSVGRLSRMDALQVQAMAMASEERRRTRLRRLEAAFRRLAENEFGYCATCGEPIPAERLDFDPTITRCVQCAE